MFRRQNSTPTSDKNNINTFAFRRLFVSVYCLLHLDVFSNLLSIPPFFLILHLRLTGSWGHNGDDERADTGLVSQPAGCHSSHRVRQTWQKFLNRYNMHAAIDITCTRQFPRLHAGIFLAFCAEISWRFWAEISRHFTYTDVSSLFLRLNQRDPNAQLWRYPGIMFWIWVQVREESYLSLLHPKRTM